MEMRKTSMFGVFPVIALLLCVSTGCPNGNPPNNTSSHYLDSFMERYGEVPSLPGYGFSGTNAYEQDYGDGYDKGYTDGTYGNYDSMEEVYYYSVANQYATKTVIVVDDSPLYEAAARYDGYRDGLTDGLKDFKHTGGTQYPTTDGRYCLGWGIGYPADAYLLNGITHFPHRSGTSTVELVLGDAFSIYITNPYLDVTWELEGSDGYSDSGRPDRTYTYPGRFNPITGELLIPVSYSFGINVPRPSSAGTITDTINVTIRDSNGVHQLSRKFVWDS